MHKGNRKGRSANGDPAHDHGARRWLYVKIEQSDEDHAVVEEQEEDLEIFKSAAEILSENSDNNRTRQANQPNQSALNLLPNNDILNQIANQTGS